MWTTQPIAPTHVCIPHKSTTVFPGPRLASTAEHKQRVNNIFELLPQVTFTAQAVIWAWSFNPLNINTWYSTRKNRNLRRAYMQTTAKVAGFLQGQGRKICGSQSRHSRTEFKWYSWYSNEEMLMFHWHLQLFHSPLNKTDILHPTHK